MISRLVIVYLVVVVSIIASAGMFFIIQTSQSTTTFGISTTKTGNESSLTAFSTDRNGLETFLSINASTVTTGQAINITVYDFNPTASNLTVNITTYPSAPNYSAPGMSLRPCGGGLISMSIYHGYYTFSNISEATPLQLFWLVASCPSSGLVWPQYIFLPQSSWFDSAHGSGAMIDSERFYGYYVPGYNCPYYNGTAILGTETQCLQVQPFPSGIYTVAGGDRLGGLDILHLTVLE